MQNKINDYLKKLISLNILKIVFIVATACAACKNKSPQTVMPVVEPAKEFSFKYKSSTTVELKEIKKGNAAQDLAVESLKEYFGDDFASIPPDEILVRQDSLLLYKAGAVIQKFKVTWEGNSFSIYQPYLEKYIAAGTVQNNATLSLNVAYYLGNSNNDTRQLTSIGKAYFLNTYTDVSTIEDDFDSLIWLKIQYIFE